MKILELRSLQKQMNFLLEEKIESLRLDENLQRVESSLQENFFYIDRVLQLDNFDRDFLKVLINKS